MVNHVNLMGFFLFNEVISAIESMENELLIVNLKLDRVVRRIKPQITVSIEQNFFKFLGFRVFEYVFMVICEYLIKYIFIFMK